jgi:uncharacterized membrane protein
MLKPKVHLLILLLAIGFTVSRILLTASFAFGFMIWNLFLSWAAFMMYNFSKHRSVKQRKSLKWFVGLLWVILLPNTYYLLTDFIHLGESSEITPLFDVALFATYSLIGFWHGNYILKGVYRDLIAQGNKDSARLVIYLLAFLSGGAVSVGRFLRWNSWDVFIRPLSLLADVGERLINPLGHLNEVLTVIVFTVMIIAYFESSNNS